LKAAAASNKKVSQSSNANVGKREVKHTNLGTATPEIWDNHGSSQFKALFFFGAAPHDSAPSTCSGGTGATCRTAATRSRTASRWVKIRNPRYSQMAGRDELFERQHGADGAPEIGWDFCDRACAAASGQ